MQRNFSFGKVLKDRKVRTYVRRMLLIKVFMDDLICFYNVIECWKKFEMDNQNVLSLPINNAFVNQVN